MPGERARFHVFGRVDMAPADGSSVLLAPRERTILAILLLHVNSPISNTRLMELLWDDEDRSMKTVYAYISVLRRAMAKAVPEAKIIRESSYLTLRLPDPDMVDVQRFDRHITTADAATDKEIVLAEIEAAIGASRSEPLEELKIGVRLGAVRTGLANRARGARLRRGQLLLNLGRTEAAVAGLDECLSLMTTRWHVTILTQGHGPRGSGVSALRATGC